ncbi:ABC transporter permease [Paenibacillus sp. HGF5]|uniref:ABC transporter permease n=1 Tax=Paenibacillus sp. HGF5 TaxID=908341 RepID=UPI0002072B0C|nr:ABC transporter permease [Paenibacillus sp. HGF5]EGG31235.1 ABC superfamily ATP binding cassette transporter [Paenibacillus sp. HGF5]
MIPNPQDIEPAAVSHSLGTRFRYTISDVWVLAQRELLHWRGQPGVIIINWLFPVLMVLMFGLLFGGAIVVPDGGAYFEFLMPGMYAMTMLFGVESTVMAVTSDASKGVTDRFRSMPMNASAVVIGRCAADMLNSVIGLAVLIASGLLLGWRWHDGLGNALLAVLLLLLLRFALLWVGIYIGLIAKSPHIVSAVQLLVWPVGFLSNVFVDPSTMPAWLGAIAEWNPLSATSSSARELFLNPGWQGNSWMSEHSVMLSIVWPIALIAIFLPMSVRRYRQLSR